MSGRRAEPPPKPAHPFLMSCAGGRFLLFPPTADYGGTMAAIDDMLLTETLKDPDAAGDARCQIVARTLTDDPRAH